MRDAEAGYPLDSAFRWHSSRKIPSGKEDKAEELVDAVDTLISLHPIYVIPWGAVERCYGLFSQKAGF